MSLVKSIGSKKVNLDFNKEFINIFSDKIKTSDISFINQSLKDLHPSDTANLIENLSQETRAKLLEIEEFNLDPEIFIEINESIQSEVLQLLSEDSIAKILKRLESDDSLKILENLESDKKNLVHSCQISTNIQLGGAEKAALHEYLLHWLATLSSGRCRLRLLL